MHFAGPSQGGQLLSLRWSSAGRFQESEGVWSLEVAAKPSIIECYDVPGCKMMNSEHFLLEGFPLPTYSYPAQGQMTLLQDNSTTSRKCVCVCALFFPFPSGQLQRMAPKRFGIEFLLIHLLFLPGLPLLHQLFHHKMPQIQNRQRRI